MAQKTGTSVEEIQKQIRLQPKFGKLYIHVQCRVKEKEASRGISTGITLSINMENIEFEDIDEKTNEILMALFFRGEEAMWDELIRWARE